MNRQAIFDKVIKHLFTQGEQSLSETNGCAYRGQHGMRCAIGCLIPPRVYDQFMEGKTVDSLIDTFPKLGEHLKLSDYPDRSKDIGLLSMLQSLHDMGHTWVTTKNMQDGCAHIAQEFKLSMDKVKDLRFKDR